MVRFTPMLGSLILVITVIQFFLPFDIVYIQWTVFDIVYIQWTVFDIVYIQWTDFDIVYIQWTDFDIVTFNGLSPL